MVARGDRSLAPRSEHVCSARSAAHISARTLVSTSRLEAFSDGVFAIAATLLVLELHVPATGSGLLWPQIVAQWPLYACYMVSFLTIGIIWVNTTRCSP
jgi:uncharacterized membrane protein